MSAVMKGVRGTERAAYSVASGDEFQADVVVVVLDECLKVGDPLGVALHVV
jgi:hypothetical protein